MLMLNQGRTFFVKIAKNSSRPGGFQWISRITPFKDGLSETVCTICYKSQFFMVWSPRCLATKCESHVYKVLNMQSSPKVRIHCCKSYCSFNVIHLNANFDVLLHNRHYRILFWNTSCIKTPWNSIGLMGEILEAHTFFNSHRWVQKSFESIMLRDFEWLVKSSTT